MLDYNENEINIRSQSFCTLNLFEELSSLEDKKKILDLPIKMRKIMQIFTNGFV